MVSFLENFPPIIQALWGTGFTYLMTALGALGVFLGRELDKRLLNGMMGFAAGVMIAASYFSLLAPSIELSADLPGPIWLPAVGGFLIGGGFLWAVDKLLPHLHIGDDQPEGLRTTWQRNILLVFAITLHNIPEGLAVGVAFGAANAGLSGASLTSAIALALGIGIQNFPEGLAVSMPLRGEGISKGRAFFWGQLSGLVEPIAAVIGAAATLSMQNLLPYALAFAAGAMIYVVAEELIPEAKMSSSDHSDIPTIGVLLGFAIMMLLDVALG